MMPLWILLIPLLMRVGIPVLSTASACALWLALSGNIHPVIAGEYYRSGQLEPAHLEQVIAQYGIRSVVNLRGMNPGSRWYDDEVRLTRQLGVAHYDVRLSARRNVTPRTLDAIRTLLNQIPKPVLIHCKGGADRSGLIAALLRLEQGDTPAQAQQQLSLRYGHFPWFGNATSAMDQSFAAYVRQNRLPWDDTRLAVLSAVMP